MAVIQPHARYEVANDVSGPATLKVEAWGHVLIFLIAFGLFLSRRPDAILNAQFFAEDGRIWYQHAYQYGLKCLLIPDGGYLHTVSRLIALVSLLVPLAYAPLLMNLCAMALQILPINFFLFSRFSSIDLRLRFCCAALYVGLPNSAEIDANITTLQWHLALLAMIVLLAKPMASKLWMVFDFA